MDNNKLESLNNKHVMENQRHYELAYNMVHGKPSDLDVTHMYSGRILLRHLMILSQNRYPCAFNPMSPWMLWAMFYTFAVPLVAFAVVRSEDPYNPDWSLLANWKIWVFVFNAFPGGAMMGFVNFFFVRAAVANYQRKKFMMRQLSFLVTYSVHKKNLTAVLQPTFNFMCSTSILTWLDIRQMVLGIGKNFELRMIFY